MANLPALYAEAWTNPRASMRRILSLNLSERDRVMLVGVTGILFAIPLALVMKTMEMPTGPDGTPFQPPSAIMTAMLVAGVVIFNYYLISAGIKFVGGLFGGTGSFAACRSTAAWTQFVVGLANLALMVVSIVLPAAFFGIIQLVFLFAAIYVGSAYIAEAHGFRSTAFVAVGYVGVIFLIALLLIPLMPAEMLQVPQ